MIQANVHEAKTRLSQLIARAESGEEVVIARDGTPVVRLQPLAGERRRGRDIVGCMASEIAAPSEAGRAGLDAEIAAEMLVVDKFDVALDDDVEFIPAAR